MNQIELRDIHLPDSSLWWPPAPGWWLSLLLLLLLAVLLSRLPGWFRHKPARQLALRELARIRRDYKQGQSERVVLNEVAELLRRVAISYYGRDAAAAATGAEWLRQLQQLAPQASLSARHLDLLVHERYRPRCEFDVEELLQDCERWLRALPRSSGHV
jgi:hypothetical protein